MGPSIVRSYRFFGSKSPILSRLLSGSVILVLVTLGLVLLGVAVGPVGIPFWQSLTTLLEFIGLGQSSATRTEVIIIESVRLPRIALSLVVGSALGGAGAAMQGLFRNHMADPGIIGVSAGGVLGAVIVIAVGAESASALSLPMAAFGGAIVAAFVVYGIGSVGGGLSVAALLLSGVAISSFLGAITSAVLYFTVDTNVQREIIFWLAGGLDSSTWSDVQISLPAVAIGLGIVLFLARDLNLLALGDDEAASLGVRVGRARTFLIVGAALSTGSAVAFSGTIIFVGLIVPHMVREVLGADHRVLIPLSALSGAAFLLLADTTARVIAAPAELRVGIVTAFIGAPFFIYLLIKNKVHVGSI